MFREKCHNCRKKVKKNFEFCPFCGANLRKKEDYGFLGKEDFFGHDLDLPFGFNMLMKPLIKELNKQLVDLDKELKVENKNIKKPVQSFSMHISLPGQKPIKITSGNMGHNLNDLQQKKEIKLPKIDEKVLKNVKGLVKKEPKTNIRRLSDRVIYEVELPNVVSIESININKLEEGYEIKAVSKECQFVKELRINFPLLGYSFENELLVLEMSLNKV